MQNGFPFPESIDIPPGGSAELNIAFAIPGEEGCWIASKEAMLSPTKDGPGYLPPGEYLIEVMVKAKNARPVRKKFKIFSPKLGEELRIEEA